MNNQNRVLGLIGIAMKAGKISFGTESVKEATLKKKAKLVIIAENGSDRLKKEFIQLCEKCKVPIATFCTIEQISQAIGKQNKAVICIKDKNLSEEIYKIICGGEAIG